MNYECMGMRAAVVSIYGHSHSLYTPYAIVFLVCNDISSFRTSVYKTKEPVVQTGINSLLFWTLLLGHSGGNSWGIQVGIHGAFNGHSGVIIGHSCFWATQGHSFSHSTAVAIRVEVTYL